MLTASWQPPPAVAPALAHGAVHVWRVFLSLASTSTLSLSSDELARASSLEPASCKRYVAGRGALRAILARYANGAQPSSLCFTRGLYGKPALNPPYNNIRFNVSHSGGLYVAAVARGDDVDLGIDVERIDRVVERDVHKLAKRWLHHEEAERVGGDARRFVRAWTRKEACVKTRGEGIARGGMRRFQVTKDDRLLYADGEEDNDVSIIGFDDKDWAGCVAVRQSSNLNVARRRHLVKDDIHWLDYSPI
jgi:4'-phosphopantetheinyl transferase